MATLQNNNSNRLSNTNCITSATTNFFTTNHNCSNNTNNKWNDIPKRLTTICIGVPILWTIWIYTITRILFFQILHILLVNEWIQIVFGQNQKNQNQNHQQRNQQQNQKQHINFDNNNTRNAKDDTKYKSKIKTTSIVYWMLPIMSLVLANITNDELFLSILFLYIAISTILFPNHNHYYNTTTTTTNTNNSNSNSNSNNNTTSNIIIPLIQCTLFITIPLRSWNTIVQHQHYGCIRTVTLLFTVWNCDTGSLLVGRQFSKNNNKNSTNTSTSSTTTGTTDTKNKIQLSSSSSYSSIQLVITRIRLWLSNISPNKSLEGIVGGICFGIVTYIILPWIWLFLYKIHVLPLHVQVPTSSITMLTMNDEQQQEQEDYTNDNNYFICLGIYDIIVGIVLSFGAIVGDLVESTYKRQYNVKDSSTLLPGHGGILDRFDSSLVSIVLYGIIIQYRHSIILFIQQHILCIVLSTPDSNDTSNTYFRPY